MSKQKTFDLSVKDGEEQRIFRLSEMDFMRFLSMFEEKELVDFGNFDFSNIKLREVSPSCKEEEK